MTGREQQELEFATRMMERWPAVATISVIAARTSLDPNEVDAILALLFNTQDKQLETLA